MIRSNSLRMILGLASTLILIVLPAYISGTVQTEGAESTGGYADFWLVRLFLNLLGYATVAAPAALLIYYFKRTKYNERAGPGCMSSVVRLIVYGNEEDVNSALEEGSAASADSSSTKNETAPISHYTKLAFCFFGLQASYLTWGLLQERIMKHEYGGDDTHPGVKFKNSQFLVFMNRVLAFLISAIACVVLNHPRHRAPLYKYSYSSISNIMSSWFQYEALKFVSFPTQVLAKASKIIPVMLMGKLVSKKTYEWNEYFTALLISVGVGLFLLTNSGEGSTSTVTTFSGVLLLIGYMLFDSFTSNWQGELFNQYKMSSIQMMAGVNLFSCLFTSASLFEQAGFFESVQFMIRYPEFMFHVMLLSICSASGQLFIFYTISQFGPVTFVIIMTIRQACAILLSCMVYNHAVSLLGIVGIFVVFLALSLKIYWTQQRRKQKMRAANTMSSTNGKL